MANVPLTNIRGMWCVINTNGTVIYYSYSDDYKLAKTSFEAASQILWEQAEKQGYTLAQLNIVHSYTKEGEEPKEEPTEAPEQQSPIQEVAQEKPVQEEVQQEQ